MALKFTIYYHSRFNNGHENVISAETTTELTTEEMTEELSKYQGKLFQKLVRLQHALIAVRTFNSDGSKIIASGPDESLTF